MCGALAEYECRDCYGVLQTGSGLESTAFCTKCIDTAHMHSKRQDKQLLLCVLKLLIVFVNNNLWKN